MEFLNDVEKKKKVGLISEGISVNLEELQQELLETFRINSERIVGNFFGRIPGLNAKVTHYGICERISDDFCC